MPANRSIIIGISLLAMILAGIYLSRNTSLEALVNGGNQDSPPSAIDAGSSTSITNCSFDTSMSPTHDPIILSEIAWMGDATSSNDEWIELANISTSTIHIGGWELIDKNEKIKAVFRSGANITAGGFYLLERGGMDFLTGKKADMFFIGSLKNSGDSFRLFDSDCHLIDEAIAGSGWLAGDNAKKDTMERDSKTLAWYTSKIKGGTPRAENDGQNDRYNHDVSIPTSASTSPAYDIQSPIPFLSTKSNVTHILISQVQITGGKGNTNDDFIELYNPNGGQADLKGYRLVKRAGENASDVLIKSWTTGAIIPAYGFYLWANSGYADISVVPDSTTSATLSEDDAIALRLGSNDTGTIIDSVAWGKSQNAFSASGTVSSFNQSYTFNQSSSSNVSSSLITSNSFPLNPGVDQSIMRKSWQNGACIAASFEIKIGNGCDTGNDAQDFELMQVAEPRDSKMKSELF